MIKSNQPVKKALPETTIERLSEYRRSLIRLVKENARPHIFSHELARLHSITAVQVRRDMMLIGYTSDASKGYEIEALVLCISEILDASEPQNVAIIGMGNLAQAITHYFDGKRPNLQIVMGFDIEPSKVDSDTFGIPCHHIDGFVEKCREYNIDIVILTCPRSVASSLIYPIECANVKGVLNFTSATLELPSNIYVEDYDIITLLEKVAYFSKPAACATSKPNNI